MASQKPDPGQPTLTPAKPPRKRNRISGKPSATPPPVSQPPAFAPDIESQIRALVDQLKASVPGQGLPEVQRIGNSCTLTWQSSLTITLGPADADPAEESRGVSAEPRPQTALELASLLLQHPGLWLKTPNENLGNRKPIDLIGTDEEDKVYNMLNAYQHGMFS